jgi:hypothetical protein
VGSGENGNEHGGSIKDMVIAKGVMYFSVKYFRRGEGFTYIRYYTVVCVINANVNRVNYIRAHSLSMWPCALWRRSAAARLLVTRGSNSAEGMDARLLCSLYGKRPLRRADQSFRGV